MDVDENFHSQLTTHGHPPIMTHPNETEYFTLSSVCQYDGTTTILGIFEDMDAVMYRIKGCYTSCGDEYRIECFHLQTAEQCAVRYNELMVSRAKAKKEKEEASSES